MREDEAFAKRTDSCTFGEDGEPANSATVLCGYGEVTDPARGEMQNRLIAAAQIQRWIIRLWRI